MSVDWVSAGAASGFLLLAAFAGFAGVPPEAILLRGGVGALVGALLGFGITRIPVPDPQAPTKSWKPEPSVVDVQVGEEEAEY